MIDFLNIDALGFATILIVPLIIHLWQKHHSKIEVLPTLMFLPETKVIRQSRLKIHEVPLLFLRLILLLLFVLILTEPVIQSKRFPSEVQLVNRSELNIQKSDKPRIYISDSLIARYGWLDLIRYYSNNRNLTILAQPKLEHWQGVKPDINVNIIPISYFDDPRLNAVFINSKEPNPAVWLIESSKKLTQFISTDIKQSKSNLDKSARNWSQGIKITYNLNFDESHIEELKSYITNYWKTYSVNTRFIKSSRLIEKTDFHLTDQLYDVIQGPYVIVFLKAGIESWMKSNYLNELVSVKIDTQKVTEPYSTLRYTADYAPAIISGKDFAKVKVNWLDIENEILKTEIIHTLFDNYLEKTIQQFPDDRITSVSSIKRVSENPAAKEVYNRNLSFREWLIFCVVIIFGIERYYSIRRGM